MVHIPVQLSKPLLCFFGSVLHMCSSGVSSGFLILTHRTRRYPSPAIFSLGFPYTSQLSRVPFPCSCSSDQKEVFFSVYLPLAISIYLGLTSVRENRKKIERKIIKQCGFPSIYCLHSIGYVTIDMGFSLGAFTCPHLCPAATITQQYKLTSGHNQEREKEKKYYIHESS